MQISANNSEEVNLRINFRATRIHIISLEQPFPCPRLWGSDVLMPREAAMTQSPHGAPERLTDFSRLSQASGASTTILILEMTKLSLGETISSLSLFLSLCLSLCLPPSLCVSLSVFLSLCPPLSISVSLSLSLPLSASASLCLYLCLPRLLSPSSLTHMQCLDFQEFFPFC